MLALGVVVVAALCKAKDKVCTTVVIVSERLFDDSERISGMRLAKGDFECGKIA